MIPDDLNGIAGTTVPGMEGIIAGALQQQGLDAGDAEFAFVTFGTDENAVVLNAFRLPGVSPGDGDVGPSHVRRRSER